MERYQVGSYDIESKARLPPPFGPSESQLLAHLDSLVQTCSVVLVLLQERMAAVEKKLGIELTPQQNATLRSLGAEAEAQIQSAASQRQAEKRQAESETPASSQAGSGTPSNTPPRSTKKKKKT